MAGEAVLKIKQAEEAGRELVRAATEEARQITQSYAQNAAEQRETILVKARNTRDKIIDSAVKKAQAECGKLSAEAEKEKQSILSPGAERLEAAIKYITERIVSA